LKEVKASDQVLSDTSCLRSISTPQCQCNSEPLNNSWPSGVTHLPGSTLRIWSSLTLK